MNEHRLKTGETIAEFKRRKGLNYEEKAARYPNVRDIILELVRRHRGDIPEAFAQALGDEAMKRLDNIRTTVEGWRDGTERIDNSQHTYTAGMRDACQRVLDLLDGKEVIETDAGGPSDTRE